MKNTTLDAARIAQLAFAQYHQTVCEADEEGLAAHLIWTELNEPFQTAVINSVRASLATATLFRQVCPFNCYAQFDKFYDQHMGKVRKFSMEPRHDWDNLEPIMRDAWQAFAQVLAREFGAALGGTVQVQDSTLQPPAPVSTQAHPLAQGDEDALRKSDLTSLTLPAHAEQPDIFRALVQVGFTPNVTTNNNTQSQ